VEVGSKSEETVTKTGTNKFKLMSIAAANRPYATHIMTVIGRVIAGICIAFAVIKAFAASIVVIVSVVIVVRVMTDVLCGYR
jgi:hypothetical protein